MDKSMVDIFDVAYDDFYMRWVIEKMDSIDEGLKFFKGLSSKTNVQDFKNFLYSLKEKNVKLNEEFNAVYNKENLKSFINFLYLKNKDKIEKNIKDLKDKVNIDNYFLVWLISLFKGFLSEYFIDIEKVKKEKIECNLYELKLFENDSGNKIEKIRKEIKEDLKNIDKITKRDFVINGKYSNQDLFEMLNTDFAYYNFISVDNLILGEEDFFNLFNYPLKDYVLFMLFLEKMSLKPAKEHLREYIDSHGDEKVIKKYDLQKNILCDLLHMCNRLYISDKGEFIFHDVEIGFGERGVLTGDYYFNWEFCKARSNILGIGCILYEDMGELYPIFGKEYFKLVDELVAEEDKKFEERMKKNPKFYKEFKERNKRLWKASSFGSVLGKGN